MPKEPTSHFNSSMVFYFPESFCFAQHGWYLLATDAFWDGKCTPYTVSPSFICCLHRKVWHGTDFRITVVPPPGRTQKYTSSINSILIRKIQFCRNITAQIKLSVAFKYTYANMHKNVLWFIVNLVTAEGCC